VLKLCYQSAFGAEHLLSDPREAEAAFRAEWETVNPVPGPLAEAVGPDVCRLRLEVWKARGLPPEWLFRLFCQAARPRADGTARMAACLAAADAAAAAGALPFSPAAWQSCRRSWEAAGGGPVHHSNAYRAAEHPAYRVAEGTALRALPVLERMAALPGGTVAIDGRAASGKTTLAGTLQCACQAGVVHMDDFFLPPELRTPARLAQPGGNIHAERFAAEVLPQLGRAFSYRRFSCETLQYDGVQNVPAGVWTVVEGAYSCRPDFGDYAAVRVFSDIAPEEQLRRIRLRDGEALAVVFAQRWIPLEERYFAAFPIRQRADLTL
jgi:hypothetical protein